MAQTKQQLADAKTGGLPPGLEGVKRVLEGISRADGTGVSMVFCETAEDLRKADQALNDMSPSSEASGRRVSAGMYEIVTDEELT